MKLDLKFFFLIVLAVNCFACSNPNKKVEEILVVEIDSLINVNPSLELLDAVLWVQNSAEYKACCYQAFNFAKIAVENNLKEMKLDKPAAVVFDLDETLLDNSKYEAQLIKDAKVFSKKIWTEWCNAEAATAVPGAMEFIEYIMSKGIEVVYISNRLDKSEKEATILNMKKIGFPDIKPENMKFKINTSSKADRRKEIESKYNVILYVGDNLADFNDIFEQRTKKDDKTTTIKKQQNLLGTYYIILPNPMYGDWAETLENTTQERIDSNIQGWRLNIN